MNWLADLIPPAWRTLLAPTLETPAFAQLCDFLTREFASAVVFPPRELIFNALSRVSPDDVRVVILGQDPYHGDNQAHGLAFSVRDGVVFPPSLRNILKELQSDLGVMRPDSGDLSAWTAQGVLLLNAVLTVRAHEPASHAKRGWEVLTDALMLSLAQRERPCIFVLWGDYARKKGDLIRQNGTCHRIIESAHPSPLSASRGFLGSAPFSKINDQFSQWGQLPIDWCLSKEDYLC